MKIYATSDLHIDYPENKYWLFNLSKYDYQNDIIIVAGDISSDSILIEEAFIVLKQCFREVFFTYGNHDLWVINSKIKSSLMKLKLINEIAKDNGVHMEAHDFNGISIVPIASWYDFSFGKPSIELISIWRDFKACKFLELQNNEEINIYIKSMNEKITYNRNNIIISFSHFLPDIKLLPSFIPDDKKILTPVLGSNYINQYIKQMNSSIHIYGHSHINMKVKMDNITYINNAFGYPYETLITSKKLICVYENS